MENALLIATIAATATIGVAKADPVGLDTYVDKNGFIDVQTLTCAQLANTYQEDANALTTWYSGWYNGLAHKHFLDLKKGREAEHEVIVYCKEHPDEKIIHAIGVVFKDMRAEVDHIREQLFKKINEIPTSQYLEGKRFVNDFDDARLALERGEALTQVNYQKWAGGGKNLDFSAQNRCVPARRRAAKYRRKVLRAREIQISQNDN